MKAGMYKHYKGGYYQVIGIGQHTETDELLVVYVSLDALRGGPRIRCRPLEGEKGFDGMVNVGVLDCVKIVKRFEYVGDFL